MKMESVPTLDEREDVEELKKRIRELETELEFIKKVGSFFASVENEHIGA